MIRRAIKAPDGYSLLACDSSQIEARIIACLANQADLVQAFREGRDVYSEFASAVYEREITREDKMERFVGKTCILGLGYQMGAERLRKTLALGGGGLSVVLTEQEAARIVSIYRHKNYAISRFWERCSVALRHMVVGGGGELYRGIFYDAEGVVVPNGFRLRYPGLVSVGRGFRYISSPRDYEKLKRNPYPSEDNAEGIGWVNIYGGKMTENLVQLLAALVIREQMVEVAKHYQVLFQVHDELVVLVPEGEEAEATAVVEHIMATPRPWMPELPLACESSYGKNYGDL
jgi:DNA polymerase